MKVKGIEREKREGLESRIVGERRQMKVLRGQCQAGGALEPVKCEYKVLDPIECKYVELSDVKCKYMVLKRCSVFVKSVGALRRVLEPIEYEYKVLDPTACKQMGFSDITCKYMVSKWCLVFIKCVNVLKRVLEPWNVTIRCWILLSAKMWCLVMLSASV